MIITVTLAILIALLVLSVPVAAVLIILGLSIGEIFSDFPLYRVMGGNHLVCQHRLSSPLDPALCHAR